MSRDLHTERHAALQLAGEHELRRLETAQSSPGPLTAEELTRYRAMRRRPYIPEGCDQQGRRPLDDDDDLACATGVLRAVAWSLALYCAGIVAWLALT